jgi:hypothetical protein
MRSSHVIIDVLNIGTWSRLHGASYPETTLVMFSQQTETSNDSEELDALEESVGDGGYEH